MKITAPHVSEAIGRIVMVGHGDKKSKNRILHIETAVEPTVAAHYHTYKNESTGYTESRAEYQVSGYLTRVLIVMERLDQVDGSGVGRGEMWVEEYARAKFVLVPLSRKDEE